MHDLVRVRRGQQHPGKNEAERQEMRPQGNHHRGREQGPLVRTTNAIVTVRSAGLLLARFARRLMIPVRIQGRSHGRLCRHFLAERQKHQSRKEPSHDASTVAGTECEHVAAEGTPPKKRIRNSSGWQNPPPARYADPAMAPAAVFGLYVLTACAEIVGCYLTYSWLRKSGSAWLLLPAAASLALFAWLLTLHASPVGRTYAAYGGIYIATAVLGLWLVERQRPDRWDIVGSLICLVGVAVILWGPRRG